jgi:hypothetical protein
MLVVWVLCLCAAAASEAALPTALPAQASTNACTCNRKEVAGVSCQGIALVRCSSLGSSLACSPACQASTSACRQK